MATEELELHNGTTITNPAARRFVAEAATLVQALFALEEPWRQRFLRLIADMATNSSYGSQQPRRAEVSVWLASRPRLRRQVKQMLDVWQGADWNRRKNVV
jgi:hypothetical protein